MKPNRVCLYCGKEYYACLSCLLKTAWERIYCSKECYEKSLKDAENKNNEQDTTIKEVVQNENKLENKI